MRILRLAERAVHRVRYVNAGRRGKRESSVLPILLGDAEGLGEGVDAWIVTSDLQGVAPGWDGANVLLGVALVDALLELSEHGVLPYPERTGVVLAGDLYSAPAGNVRGASGDVREVWEAFAASYRWVVGVAGNHDRFGEGRERARFEATDGVHLLDGDTVDLDGVGFGGVGEIVGDPDKAGRKSEGEFFERLDHVTRRRPDVLVLHQGPEGEHDQPGEPRVNGALVDFEGQVVCGHVHWERPRATNVLNVDGRVVVLRAA
ncbi:MAG: metallophosphoesterase [Sandaracinus sp.]|nr:metallophosphoesterase [Sandaracinus sp.]